MTFVLVVLTWHSSATEEEIFERCTEIDHLYNSIKNDGYKTQSELDQQGDEVTVSIARDGSLIQTVHGKHRFR